MSTTCRSPAKARTTGSADACPCLGAGGMTPAARLSAAIAILDRILAGAPAEQVRGLIAGLRETAGGRPATIDAGLRNFAEACAALGFPRTAAAASELPMPPLRTCNH